MHWYFQVLRKYADFGGRARRKEYWMFALINGLILGVLYAAGLQAGAPEMFGMILLVYLLFTILPNLAVSVRRLHDTGRSGWWLLLYIVPIVGPLALFVFTVQDSESGSNDWGPNPKMA